MRERAAPRQPMFMATLAFAGGVAAAVYAWRPATWWAAAALLFLLFSAVLSARARKVVSSYEWRTRAAFALVLASLFALGAWSLMVRDAAAPRQPSLKAFLAPAPLSPRNRGEPIVITAHVLRDGVLRGSGRQTVDVETESISDVPLNAGIRVLVYPNTKEKENNGSDPGMKAAAPFTYGQRLRFETRLRAPRNFNNPGAWDYRGHLQRQGIIALASVREDRIEVLPGVVGKRWELWRSQARGAVLARIHALWPCEQAGLLDAMLIGERSSIARETTTAWQRTGIYHILVVSGANVGILAFVIFWILRRLRAGEVTATILTLLLSGGYAFLAEADTPVLRAVLMMALYLGARLLYREGSLLNAVGAAALVLLVAEPRALFEASFQLTFLSVVAIAGIGVPLLERMSQPYRLGLRHPGSLNFDFKLAPRIAQFRLDLRLLAERIGSLAPVPAKWRTRLALRGLIVFLAVFIGIFDVMAITGLMQVALALPMASYFHRATVMALPANTIAVPLTEVLMPSAALALGLAFLAMPLARAAGWVAALSLKGILLAVDVLGSIPLADHRLASPSMTMTLVAAGSFVLALLVARRQRWLAALGLGSLVASGVWLMAGVPEPQVRHGQLEVTAIDVGQAESLLVVTPQGKTLLVDAAGSIGPFASEFDFGESVISPYLWARGLSRLDAVMLTHAHSDHMGGMNSVISNFRPREFWLGLNAPSRALKSVLQHAAKQQVRIVPRMGGDVFEFGGATFRVLAPARDWQPGSRTHNDDSLVVEVGYGSTAALLTADIDRQIERRIVAEGARADLLKVAHNGSNTSTSLELLSALRPRYGMISVGSHNIYGHPKLEVLERLRSKGVATFRTDTVGALTFYLDGQQVTPAPAALATLPR